MKDIYKRYIEMYINQVGEKYAVLVKSMISKIIIIIIMIIQYEQKPQAYSNT